MADAPAPARNRLPAIVTRAEAPPVRVKAHLEWRSLENPSTPLSAPDDWLYDALGSYRASSGVNVNAQTALSYAAIWRCVNLIAGDAARLPLAPWRGVKRGRELHTSHPSYRLVRHKPNSEMTAGVVKKTGTAHVLLQGNHYSYIQRDGEGRPLELIPVNPTQMYPIRVAGKLWYVLDVPNLAMRKIDPRDILHLRGLSYDGLLGYSVVAKARESWGLGMAMQTYTSIFFRNNAEPRVVFEYPEGMKPEAVQNLRESWERMHAGLENAHRTAVLRGGVKLHQIKISARDAQLVDSRAFEIREIANWFGVPPHKLGDPNQTSYNSLEQSNQSYLDEALDPILTMWEEECWDKLLTDREKERGDVYFEFDRKQLLRANLQERTAWYTFALPNGILSPNEVREEEGKNPRQDAEGDQYAQNTNNTRWVGGEDPDADEDGAPAAAQGEPGTEVLDLPDVPCTGQGDCIPALVMSVCKYFGKGPDTLADYVAALGTTPAAGTPPAAVADYLTRQGLVVTAASNLSIEDLVRFYKAGQPTICYIQDYVQPGEEQTASAGHGVAVIGLALGQVILQDPSVTNVVEDSGMKVAPGRKLMAADDFLAAWHDVGADGTPWERFGIAVGEEVLQDPEPAPEEGTGANGENGGASGGKPAASGGQDSKGNKKPAKKGQPAGAPVRADGAAGSAGKLYAANGALLEAHRALVVDATRRMLRRIGVHARKAAKKPEEFRAWVGQLAEEHRAVMLEALTPAIAACKACSTSGSLVPQNAEVDRLLHLLSESFLRFADLPAAELPAKVDHFMIDMEATLPVALADELMRAVDEPDRTVDQALDILKRLPEADKPGEVAVTMPVEEKPPYTPVAADLQGAKPKTVKLRKLIATRDTVKRNRVEHYIKNPDEAGSLWKVGGGLPLDKPYVVKSGGQLYIHDGHHRLMARQLLGVDKTEVYLIKQ